jgi:hypothetical protein
LFRHEFIFTSQAPKSIPNIIRNNIDIYVLYKFACVKMVIDKIFDEVSGLLTESQFEERVFLSAPLSRFNTTLKPKNKIICVGRWAAIKINIEKNWKGSSRLSNAHKGYLPSLEKTEHALLSIALGQCIPMSFIFLGYFCKCVYPFDICNL